MIFHLMINQICLVQVCINVIIELTKKTLEISSGIAEPSEMYRGNHGFSQFSKEIDEITSI